jgi:hypothetical protein
MSENTETAILAGGCFWPAQELLRHRDGIISTRVGYTGGENDNPSADIHPGHLAMRSITRSGACRCSKYRSAATTKSTVKARATTG